MKPKKYPSPKIIIPMLIAFCLNGIAIIYSVIWAFTMAYKPSALFVVCTFVFIILFAIYAKIDKKLNP